MKWDEDAVEEEVDDKEEYEDRNEEQDQDHDQVALIDCADEDNDGGEYVWGEVRFSVLTGWQWPAFHWVGVDNSLTAGGGA